MLNTMKKHGLTLALYAALSTALTSGVYLLTKNIIDEQAAQQQKRCLTTCFRHRFTIIRHKVNVTLSPMKS